MVGHWGLLDMDTSKQELLNEGCLFFTLYMGAPLGSCSIHYQRLVNFSFLPTYLCLNSLPSLDTYQSGCWLICENQTKGSWRLISTSSIPHELWSICGNQLMFLVTQCWKLNYPFFFIEFFLFMMHFFIMPVVSISFWNMPSIPITTSTPLFSL